MSRGIENMGSYLYNNYIINTLLNRSKLWHLLTDP